MSVKCSYQLMLWIMHNWVLCFWMVTCKEATQAISVSIQPAVQLIHCNLMRRAGMVSRPQTAATADCGWLVCKRSWCRLKRMFLETLLPGCQWQERTMRDIESVV